MKVSFIWMFAWCVAFSANAQDVEYKFNNYSVVEGLSQSTVYSVIQDSTGFIWLGTRDGLNRFDGIHFKTYRPGDSEVPIAERSIRTLDRAPNDAIWLGTDGGGVMLFNSQNETFQDICSLAAFEECNAAENVLSLVAEGKAIWAGTRDNGVVKYNLETETVKYIESDAAVWSLERGIAGTIYAGTEDGLIIIKNESVDRLDEIGSVKSLFIDDITGKLLVGTEGAGLKILNTSANSIESDFIQGSLNLNHSTVHAIGKDNKGQIWLGTDSKGIFIINFETHDVQQSSILGDEFLGNSVRSLYKDESGVMWAGSNTSGVYNFSPFRTAFKHFGMGSADTPPDVILAFEAVQQNLLLAGTEQTGLRIFNRDEKSISKPSFLANASIITLFKDSENFIWIGSDGEGLYRIRESDFPDFEKAEKIEGLSSESVLKIRELETGDILAGTYNGLNWIRKGKVIKKSMADINNANALQDDRILALLPQKNGNFWVGTYSGGLSRYSAENDEFRNYQYSPVEQNTISSNRVNTIYKDDQNLLWVGTYNGLNLYDPDSGTFENFSSSGVLPNSVIYGILEDESNNLWLSTNEGIVRFVPKTIQAEAFTVQDGLQSYEFNGGAYFKHPDGTMYFGGINGFNEFKPDLLEKNEYKPNTVVTNFSVNGNQVENTGKSQLTFNYQNNYYLFQFATLDFNKPEKHQFRYQLSGLSDNWISVNGNQSVNFSGLQPGEYTFTVQGSNGDGVWGRPSKPINFSIHPPYWETALFRIFAIILGFLLLYAAFKYRTYYLLKEEKTRNRIARDLHDDLSATLSSISFFSEAAQRVTDEKETDTRRYLGIINESAVEAKEKINDIIWAIDPTKDEWPSFLKKCKRFASDALDSKDISYQIEIDEKIEVPLTLELRQNIWLIFKEAINNLVRHSNATEAYIRLLKNKKFIVLEIKDNGIGFDKINQNSGHGISNMYYRAKQINGKVVLQTSPGEGTHLHFEFEV